MLQIGNGGKLIKESGRPFYYSRETYRAAWIYNDASGRKNELTNSLDYSLAGKTNYISWVKSIAKDLQGQEGVKRITSYDNYLDSSPQRFIEFEFDTMEDAIKYFENPTIKSILDKSVAMSINYHLNVLSLRGDHNKN